MGTTQINFPGLCYVCVLCVFRLFSISSFKASTLSYSQQYYCVFIDWMRMPFEYISFSWLAHNLNGWNFNLGITQKRDHTNWMSYNRRQISFVDGSKFPAQFSRFSSLLKTFYLECIHSSRGELKDIDRSKSNLLKYFMKPLGEKPTLQECQHATHGLELNTISCRIWILSMQIMQNKNRLWCTG